MNDGKNTAIKDAMLCLLAEKTISRIRVNDLIQRAAISRATFYLYYDDVFSLYDELIFEYLEPIRQIVSACCSYRKNVLRDTLNEIYEYIRKNSKAFSALFAGDEHLFFQRKLKKLFIEVLIAACPTEKPDYVYPIFGRVLITLTQEAILKDARIDAAELEQIIAIWLTPYV